MTCVLAWIDSVRHPAWVQIPSTIYFKFHLVEQLSVLATEVSRMKPLLERQANLMKSRLVEFGFASKVQTHELY